MGYKATDPCLKKAYDDERLFVLMTRDSTAPSVVAEWIKQNIGVQPKEKLHEALDCAIEMHERQSEISSRKHYEEDGWIFCTKEFPPPESNCEVLYENFATGKSTYWSTEEGFDAQVEPHHIQVIAWRNAKRAT